MKNITSIVFFAFCLMLSLTHGNAQIGTKIAVTGTVLDEVSRAPVTLAIVAYDESGKKINSTRSNEKEGGYYYLLLDPGMKYRVEFDHPNYFREERWVETPKSGKYAEISRDWLVRPMREGARIPLAVSPFEYKKSKLRLGAEEYLAAVRTALVKNPSVKVEIQSYPDLAENKDANLKLTTDRVAAMKDYLIQGGVTADRITVKSSADIDPLNPLPIRKSAKGKRYVGNTYIVVTKI